MRQNLLGVGLGAALVVSAIVATAAPMSASVSSGQQQTLLNEHNSVRATVAQSESARLGLDVSIPNLTWSAAAASNAQTWADSQIASIASGGPVLHNPNLSSLGYGENSYAEFGFPNVDAKRAVQFWAGERPNYTYDTNSCAAGKVCGHYTQVVWANTTGVGCGEASQGTWTVWYCDYVPAGNITGQKPYNASPNLTVTLRWSAAESSRLAQMGHSLGNIPAAQVQKKCVYVVGFILGLGPQSPTPVAAPPHGNAVTYTDVWTPSEFAVLHRVEAKYVLPAPDATRVATKIVDFLLALGGH